MAEGVLKHHICKLCNKRFPCGRSLGGHMRSHLMNQSETDSGKRKKNSNPGMEYVPRENPKLSESSSTENDTLLHTHDKVCRECGKSFCSWKALFGHMKCHSVFHSGIESDSWNVIDSHSDSEEVKNAPNRMMKRSRSRIKRNMAKANATTTNSSSLASPYVLDEQEEVALSLMMLSRNVGGVSDSVPACSDNNSEFLGAGKQDSMSKKLRNAEVEILKNPKSRASGIPTIGGSKMKNSCKLDHQIDVSECSKTRFECCSCNKIFHSYQALGGHRASHKRGKGCENSAHQTADTNNNNLELLAAQKVETSKKHIKDEHECPICFKIFPSGQALGGHKRSHFIAEAKTSQPIIEMQKPAVLPETRDFLDLNLPPPTEDDQESHHSVGFQAWWMMESSHKHGQLVGPTF